MGAAFFVIAHDGAGAVEGGWFGVAGGAERFRTGVQFKGHAATGAERPVQECDLRPASGAKTADLAHRLAAGDAERREKKIERRPRQTVFHPHRG
jgi:hypothetical protein